MGAEQLKILQLIGDGIISADEGVLLLNALATISTEESEQALDPISPGVLQTHIDATPSRSSLSHIPSWRRFWLYPLLLGVGIAIIGVLYSNLAANDAIGWGWLFVTLPGIVLGIGMVLLGWLIRSSYWLFIRVKNEDINLILGFPLPLRWLTGTLKIARFFVPELRDLDPDDLTKILAETSPQGVISVDVQESDREHVQVFYG